MSEDPFPQEEPGFTDLKTQKAGRTKARNVNASDSAGYGEKKGKKNRGVS